MCCSKEKICGIQKYFNAFHSVHNRIKMCEDKNASKNLIKKKRNQHKYINRKKIENMRFSSPRELWKLFKKERKNASNEIKLEQFFYYFSKLHECDSNIFHEDAESYCEQTDFNENDCIYEELDKRITVDEVKEVIQNIKQ